MLGRHVAAVNRALADEPAMAGAQIRRFLILHKELDADDGELTRTQKVRRSFIAERYAPLVTALYDGSTAADIATEVTFEDGRKGADRRGGDRRGRGRGHADAQRGEGGMTFAPQFARSVSPLGGRAGEGGGRMSRHSGLTPLPVPPPQGGRERWGEAQERWSRASP